MKKLNFYILLLALLFANIPRHAIAGISQENNNGSIYIEDIEVKAGEVFEIPVMFRNELAYSAFQCDINLPQGIEIEVDEYGDYCVYPESSRLTNTHTLAASKVQDGVIRVACYSTASRDIRGNDGALFHIKAKAGDGCEGDLKLTMNNIRFSTADGTEKTIKDAGCTINVGQVQGGEEVVTNDSIYIEDIEVKAGEAFEIPVMFRNELAYSAFQCDINLPQGIEIEVDEYGDYCVYPESSRLTNTHTLAASKVQDGVIRVACYSTASRDIRGNDGALFHIKAKAEDGCEGDLKLTMNNIRFSTADGTEKTIKDAGCTINVGQVQGGEEVVTNDSIYIENIEVIAGEAFEIPVMFRNELAYSAFQCDINLPQGIEIEVDEYGYYCVYPESSRLTNTHTLAVSKVQDGVIRVACYSTASRDIRGNDGALFHIKAKAGDGYEGDLKLTINNIRFSTADGTERIIRDIEGVVTIVPVTKYYTITYMVDGEEYAVDSVAYGTKIALREEPTKEGHTFSGWSEAPETMPANDIVVEGTFSVNYYSITYMLDGETYAVDSVAYGTKIELRDEPTKEGYTFSGWNRTPETMPANDIVIEGTFYANYYSITYKVDGEEYAVDSVAYGTKIQLRDEPTKEGHTFSGWSKVPETMPANDIVVEGTFSVNYYSITYIVDGEEYAVDSVAYGTKIVLRDEPAKEGHAFSGWSDAPETMPANDIVIEGNFIENGYKIIYKIDGEVYKTEVIAYGSAINLIEEPTKEGHTFSGWSEVPETMPANDIVVEGTFYVNYYNITYKVDGEEYAVDSVAYGTKIQLRDEPTKEGHTFSGWSEVPETMPANDIVIEGTFYVNYYAITYNVDGEEYAVDSVAYGTKIELRDEPTKEGHTFSGWKNVPETMPANDIVVEGTFYVNYYNITYKVDGEEYAVDSVAYGTKIQLRDEPTKEGHTFSGWSETPETMPANDIVIEGTFYVNYYAITYNVDGEEYAVDSVAYGTKIELRDEPTKEGHTFSGWSKVPETMPANDIAVEGTFSVNSYKVTYIVDGEIYATDSVAYGSKISLPEHPVKEGYSFSDWKNVPETMPANDIVIEGTFYVNYYAITYIVDGETYAVDSVAYGTKIELRDEPTKEGHTFSGWSEAPETMPAGDVTVEGEFTINDYSIIYIIDNEVYAVDNVEYGSEIKLREEPTREGYTFSGWNCEYTTMPAMDIFVYGTFTATGISAIVADDFVDVYTLNGVMIKSHIAIEMLEKELSSGVYIINGKKVYIRQQ